MTNDLENLLKAAFLTTDLSETVELPRHKLYYIIDEIHPKYFMAFNELGNYDFAEEGKCASAWKIWMTTRKMYDAADEYEEIGAEPLAKKARTTAKNLRKEIWHVGQICSSAQILREMEQSYVNMIEEIPALFSELDPFKSRQFYLELKESVRPLPCLEIPILKVVEKRLDRLRTAAITKLQDAYNRGRKYLTGEAPPELLA